MKTRGNQIPSCKTCGHMFSNSETDDVLCMLQNCKINLGDTCKKYVYDIYKYEPKKKADFAKFKKEDFEI